jgi:hypothetical protein
MKYLKKGSNNMNEELKKWLEQNPPRVELTELEKTITIKDLVQQKYFVYFDDRSFDQIYRLKIFELSDANRCSERARIGTIKYFIDLWKSLDFCPLGYGVGELRALNNMYGDFYE